MANFDTVSGAGTFRLIVNQGTQDVINNQTVVNWELHLYCYNGASYNLSPPVGWSVTINGVGYSGNYNFDFRSYSDKLIASGSTTVTHDADGTKTITVSGYTAHTGTGAIGGPISNGGSLGLTTIPRATTPIVSPTSGNTAATFTITHTPASAAFYHDIAYSLDGGGSYTDIQTNIVGTDTSTDWTPAHSLIPNATSITAIIRAITRASSGGTIIGTKTVNLPLTVPSSVKPTISSVSWADSQTSSPDLPTLMGGAGRFVQRWSKLVPTVTAAGAGGSTITGSQITQNGQTTTSGSSFSAATALSGAVPFSAVTTDSRGRISDVFVNTVSVTAYNFPSLPTPTITRTSDAGGTTPSSIGTYLKIIPLASVSSLDFSGEKNLLEWQVRTRPVGGSWTTVQAWTNSTVSGTTWTTPKIISGYAANTEYEVEVSIRDLFGKNGFDTNNTVKTLSVSVPSEFVFMDWDGNDGIGLGGYRRYGIADFHGDVYAENIYQNTNAVIDVTDLATDTVAGIVEFATPTETLTGTADDLTVTPEGFLYALEGNRDAGLFDSRYYTEAEINGALTNNAIVGMRRIHPSVVSSGGTVVRDADGTVRVSASGTTVISLNDCLVPGRSYEIDFLHIASGASTNGFRFRNSGTDYSGATYVQQGQYFTGAWSGSGADSGYGVVTSYALLSVNSQASAYSTIRLIYNTSGDYWDWFLHTTSRSGGSGTQYIANGDCSGSVSHEGLTFFLATGGTTFSAGTTIKMWELA